MSNQAQPKILHFAGPDLIRLVEHLRERLRDAGSLPAERTLAGQLEVKRHRLRKALQVLREAGDLEARDKSHAVHSGERFARSTNPLEVIEVRLALEPVLARLAAVRATSLDISRIIRAASTAPGETRGAADMAFHKAIAGASGNALAGDIYALLRRVGADNRVRVQVSNPTCPARLAQRDAEHLAIARAIEARDPEEAERTMRAHLSAVHRLIINRLTAANTV